MAGELEWLNPTDTSRVVRRSGVELRDSFSIGFAPAPYTFGWHNPFPPVVRQRPYRAALYDARASGATAPAETQPRPFSWFMAWPLSTVARTNKSNKSHTSPHFGGSSAAAHLGLSPVTSTSGGTTYTATSGVVGTSVTGMSARNSIRGRGAT